MNTKTEWKDHATDTAVWHKYTQSATVHTFHGELFHFVVSQRREGESSP